MHKIPFQRDHITLSSSDNPVEFAPRAWANMAAPVVRLFLTSAASVAIGVGVGSSVRAQSYQNFISGTVLNLTGGKPVRNSGPFGG